jgi:hypothetical protein
MQIGFYTVFRKDPQHYVHADGLIRSVRSTMPDAQIVQFTDEISPDCDGVDEVRRRPHGPMLQRRLEHYAETHGEWILVDTDVLFQRSVADVFERTFDVALTDRNWPGTPQGDQMLLTMPFNTGAVWSRCPAFWADVLKEWLALPMAQQDWMSEQRCVWQVVRTGRYRVAVLPGVMFNYPPRSLDDPLTQNAAVVHFKGIRKQWLTELVRKQWACVSAS